MQLSKEMSFLTSFSTISFALYMIQLNNIATVLCGNTATIYMQANVFFMLTKGKQAKKIMTNQTTRHTRLGYVSSECEPTHFWDDAVWYCGFSCTPESQRRWRRHLRKVLNDLTSQSHHPCSTTCFHSLHPPKPHHVCMYYSCCSLDNVAWTQCIKQEKMYGEDENKVKTQLLAIC